MTDARSRSIRWIEQGRQIGKNFSIERGGKMFHASVAIQRQGTVYRVHADEIDEGSMAAETFVRDDSRSFETLDAAIAFIEQTTPVRLEDLAPSKGLKWFR